MDRALCRLLGAVSLIGLSFGASASVSPSRDPVADTLLRARIEGRLSQDADLARDTDISVDVQDGTVLLTGSARTLYQVWEARRRASEVPGVRGVRSAIDLPRARGDAEIAFDLEGRIRSNAVLAGSSLNAEVRDGVVFLTGTARDQRVRLLAQEIAAGIDGVRRVEDRIEGPPTQDERLIAQVQTVLDSAGRGIQASIQDGVILLSGSVVSSAQREDLIRRLHGIDGVRGVVDDVEIAR